MSQVSKEIIECPYCHKEGEYEHWTSINADLNPELREKIFSGELFVCRCPHCGNEFRVPAGTLYHDMKNKFMILFDFFKPDNYEYLPVEIPEGFALHNQYIFRSVFGLQQFREKILVLEEGLDDVALERQKYMLGHIVYPEIAENGYEILFSNVNEPSDEFPYGTIVFFYNIKKSGDTMSVRIPMNRYFEHKLACELDPRMKVNGCMCVDEGWMSKLMTEE